MPKLAKASDPHVEALRKFARAIRKRRVDKIGKYLDRHGASELLDKPLLDDDASGATALHAAAGDACVEIIALLVSRGADVNAVDQRGRTPAHYATTPTAMRSLLSAAAAACQHIDRDQCDEHGLSVDECVQSMLESSDDEDTRGAVGDAAFRSRLADELDAELAEAHHSFYGFDCNDEVAAEADRTMGGDAEDWFESIARQRAAATAAAVEASVEHADARREASRLRWAAETQRLEAEEVEARRRRKQYADAALAAKAKATVAEARARYREGWAALRTGSIQAVGLSHVPWPCLAADAPGRVTEVVSAATIEVVALAPGLDAPARRRAIQLELRRWHPDKFEGTWGTKLLAEERVQVLERVKQISQELNALLAQAAQQVQAAEAAGPT